MNSGRAAETSRARPDALALAGCCNDGQHRMLNPGGRRETEPFATDRTSNSRRQAEQDWLFGVDGEWTAG